MLNKAIFLDRDGVINKRKDNYITAWDEFIFIQGVKEAIRKLNDHYIVVIVTNQSAIGRGLITERELHIIHKQMLSNLSVSGANVDAIYYCPHHPNEACACRKPKTGMIEQAINEHKINVRSSWMIGDMISDIKCGIDSGLGTILITNCKSIDSHSRSHKIKTSGIIPDYVSKNLLDAVQWLLSMK